MGPWMWNTLLPPPPGKAVLSTLTRNCLWHIIPHPLSRRRRSSKDSPHPIKQGGGGVGVSLPDESPNSHIFLFTCGRYEKIPLFWYWRWQCFWRARVGAFDLCKYTTRRCGVGWIPGNRGKRKNNNPSFSPLPFLHRRRWQSQKLASLQRSLWSQKALSSDRWPGTFLSREATSCFQKNTEKTCINVKKRVLILLFS